MRTFLMLMVLGITCLSACSGPAVTFEEAQPAGMHSTGFFSKQLIGRYRNTSDSSILTITDRCVINEYDSDFRMQKEVLDSCSDYKLKEGYVVFTITHEKAKAVFGKDTIYARFHHRDTLFCISPAHVLKKFRGYYFMNKLYQEGDFSGWEVNKLALEHNRLTIGAVSLDEDLRQLKEITETENDTLKFAPDKRQFKKFIRAGGFSDEQEYIKLSQ